MRKAIHWKSVAIVSSVFMLWLMKLPDWKLNFSSTKAVAVSQQMQETAINLRATELKKPHILSVTSSQSLTQMTGDIKLNGKSIAKLNRTSVRIDLAPSLKLGKNIVTILGKYSPASSSVNIEFIGSSNRISQQMGGSGSIDQTLVIKVQ
jgi:hypothetical protein